MKKKDPIYIPGQDWWTEHFPAPGKPKFEQSEPNSPYNKLLRTQNKLRNKKQ